MSESKVDECSVSNGGTACKKEYETPENSVSDGEIVDDDETDELNQSCINFNHRKVHPASIRSRRGNDDSDEEDKTTSDRSDKLELEKIKARIDAMKGSDDKEVSKEYKKLIEMYEVEKKNGVKPDKVSTDASSDLRRRLEPRRDFHKSSRFQIHDRRGGFINSNQFRRTGDRGRPYQSRIFPQSDRNREQFRENGRVTRPDEIRIRGSSGFLYFPRSSIKHTKSSPSISYAENPNPRPSPRHRRNSEADKNRSDKPNRSEMSKKRKEHSKKDKSSLQSKKSAKEPDKSNSPDDCAEGKTADKDNLSNVKLVVTSPFHVESDQQILDKSVQETSMKCCNDNEANIEKTEEELIKKTEEFSSIVANSETAELLTKMDPDHSKQNSDKKKLEKPKVNIFLADPDEVDEFESTLVELPIKPSRWESPESSKIEDEDEVELKIVPAPLLEETPKLHDIPVVVESPEQSPIAIDHMTESIFIPLSMPIEPLLPTQSTPKIRNVCSFLSDIENQGGIFGVGLYDDIDNDNAGASGMDFNLETSKIEPEIAKTKELAIASKTEIDKIVEPDTTGKKDDAMPSKNSDDDDSDSDDSESESSSSSDSSDTSSEESSDEETSDDEIPIATGFGRFNASSMPMVTQVKPIAVTQTTVTTPVTASRFQPQQSIIKPPGLLTHVVKPAMYTPTIVHSSISNVFFPPSTPLSATGIGQLQFPIPFKIYSLREAENNQILFPASTPAVPVAPVTPASEQSIDKKKDSDRDRREKRRSRSHSRDRDRKRFKDDRREPSDYRRKSSPQRRRSQSPSRKRHTDERGRHNDEFRKDVRRRDISPRHGSHSTIHSSRSSLSSRHSPVRKPRRSSRSKSPVLRSRSPIPRARTSPQRLRSPSSKLRRTPSRRSFSRSPSSKHQRRSISPGTRRARSPSPDHRRSPKRRYSRSPTGSRMRRTPSQEYDRSYERRSYSPQYRSNTRMESPNGYKPDSTISDTELERQQQQFIQGTSDFYNQPWNSSHYGTGMSPKRPNLDDRIHRMLSDSPTPSPGQQMFHPDGGYPYAMYGDQSGMLYQEMMYNPNLHQMPPPLMHQQQHSQSRMQPQGPFDDFSTFTSPRSFVNNSNLVEITQQKRERQRAGSNQVAVQVGNVLEIVPSNKITTSPPSQVILKGSPPIDSQPKPLTPEQLMQKAEKRVHSKLRRKADRERKRLAKEVRKEQLRLEIQRYVEAGITAEHSDDETLIKLRPVNVAAEADRSIIKKLRSDTTNDNKTVMFSDGVLPGETSTEMEDAMDQDEHDHTIQIKRKKFIKKRRERLLKERADRSNKTPATSFIKIDPELENAPPPGPPAGVPPNSAKQPRLKKITAEMFAAFPIDPKPMCYYIDQMRSIQRANGYNSMVLPPPPRNNDRFSYYKQQPPPAVMSPALNQHTNQLQRNVIVPPSNVSALDPRIALQQQRAAEKLSA